MAAIHWRTSGTLDGSWIAEDIALDRSAWIIGSHPATQGWNGIGISIVGYGAPDGIRQAGYWISSAATSGENHDRLQSAHRFATVLWLRRATRTGNLKPGSGNALPVNHRETPVRESLQNHLDR